MGYLFHEVPVAWRQASKHGLLQFLVSTFPLALKVSHLAWLSRKVTTPPTCWRLLIQFAYCQKKGLINYWDRTTLQTHWYLKVILFKKKFSRWADIAPILNVAPFFNWLSADILFVNKSKMAGISNWIKFKNRKSLGFDLWTFFPILPH